MSVSTLLLSGLLACSNAERSSDSEFSGAEMAQRTQLAFAQGSRLDRVAELSLVMEQLSPANLQDVLTVYDEYLVGLSPAELQLLMDAWVRIDPQAAFDYAQAIGYPGRRPEALEAVIASWSRVDPAAARVVVDRVIEEKPVQGQALIVPLVRGWAQSGQPGVFEYLDENAARPDLMSLVANETARRKSSAELLLWAEPTLNRLSDPELQRAVFDSVVRIVVAHDEHRAREFAFAYAREPFASAGAAVVASVWAAREPEQAIEWLEGVEGVNSTTAVGDAFRVWVQHDPVAAMQWLESQPEGDFYQSAYPVMARRKARSDVSSGLVWCERIDSREVMHRCLAGVALIWVATEPDTAIEWLEQSPLDQETRRKILRRAGYRPGLPMQAEPPDPEETSSAIDLHSPWAEGKRMSFWSGEVHFG